MLSDTLGLSALVNALHDKRGTESATKSSLLGPFYRHDAPMMKLGDSIISKSKGTEIVFYGQVVDTNGKEFRTRSSRFGSRTRPATTIFSCTIHRKWICADAFNCDSEGRYYFRGLCPTGYMIPDGWPGRRHDSRPEAPRLPPRAHSFRDWRARIPRARHGALHRRRSRTSTPTPFSA